MPLATCRQNTWRTGRASTCIRKRAVPRCAARLPPTGGTGFGCGFCWETQGRIRVQHGDKSQAAGWEDAGDAEREAHRQLPRRACSTFPQTAGSWRSTCPSHERREEPAGGGPSPTLLRGQKSACGPTRKRSIERYYNKSSRGVYPTGGAEGAATAAQKGSFRSFLCC